MSTKNNRHRRKPKIEYLARTESNAMVKIAGKRPKLSRRSRLWDGKPHPVTIRHVDEPTLTGRAQLDMGGVNARGRVAVKAAEGAERSEGSLDGQEASATMPRPSSRGA